mgnify:CR=1 FL=1
MASPYRQHERGFVSGDKGRAAHFGRRSGAGLGLGAGGLGTKMACRSLALAAEQSAGKKT